MLKILTFLKSPYRALVSRLMPETTSGLPISPAGALTHARSRVAPAWRKTARRLWQIAGLVVFFGLQLWLANVIGKLWWWYIVAFFVISGSLALVVTSPTAAFVAWLIVSPFGRHFLRMEPGSSALPIITFDLVTLYSLAALSIARTLVTRHPVRKLLTAEWLMLGFVAYVAATQMLAIELFTPVGVLEPLTRILMPEVLIICVIYFVTRASIRKKEHIGWISVGLVALGFLMALAAFYEHFTGNRWYSLVVGRDNSLLWSDIGKGRATGMFDSAAGPAALVATIFVLTWYLAGRTKKPKARLFYYLAMVIMPIGAYFTYTRNVYICLALMVLLTPFLMTRSRGRSIALAVVFVLVVSAAIPYLWRNNEFVNRMSDPKNVQERIMYAEVTRNVIKHNFWFGVGYGQLKVKSEQYVTHIKQFYTSSEGKRFVPVSHNTYLTIMGEAGFVGLFLWLGAIVAFIVRMIRIRGRLPDNEVYGKEFVSIIIASTLIFLVSVNAWSIEMAPFPYYAIWMQFALVTRLAELHEKPGSPEGSAA